jgi:hypothetical protein
MTEMVDQVAQSMRKKYITTLGLSWEDIARAAIWAMWEPTPAMLDAIPGTQDPDIAAIAAEHWRLMIAAALAPAGQPRRASRPPINPDPNGLTK